MNESQTEFELVEPLLKAAGWGVVADSRIRKQFAISQGRLLGSDGRRTQPLKADYVLQYRNRNLAVVEVKSADKHASEGVAQAKDYAGRLNIRYTYATNGKDLYEIDMEGSEGDVVKFPSPEELYERTFLESNEWRDKVSQVPFEDGGGKWQPRYYQANAITKALDAIAEGRERILLTLATGTGKTGIAFQVAWKLFKAKWTLQKDGVRSPRILFLADRNVLANQAFNSFGAFEDDALVRISPSEIRKKGHVPKNGSIFFTIFQTFMSGPGDTPYFGEYPADFFDLIIIDECHRGGANDESSWREILEYFSPAVQIGLTATPKRDVNADTYDYFGEPVYVYSLKEGINDGFLTPFRVRQIDTTISEYTYESDDVVVGGEVEEGRKYTEKDFNRIIEIREREEYRVKDILSKIDQNHKTIVFCATQLHAAAIRDLINQNSESKNPNYCHRVTADDGKLGEQHLADFQDNEKIIPTVLTTSQKLSTGVDAPEVRNIVLLRPIKSMVEFKQIIGRGTRLFEGKDYFTIYDYVEAHEHFHDDAWDGPQLPPEKPTKPTGGDEPRPPVGDDICTVCGNVKCDCLGQDKKEMIRIQIPGRKVMQIESMMKTTFWSESGEMISAEQFIKNLYGEIPTFFEDEHQLRDIWSKPDTRKKLLAQLEEKGFAGEQLDNLRDLIKAKDSDLFDVLMFIAYDSDMFSRKQRADLVRQEIGDLEDEQQSFINFVLDQYVEEGVTELDDERLPKLLEVKYHAIEDAKEKLGDIQMIRGLFIDFQPKLYKQKVR